MWKGERIPDGRPKVEDKYLDALNVLCHGKSPRYINIIGDYMFSANELSNNVTIFKISNDGLLQKFDNEIEIPSPVCILSN